MIEPLEAELARPAIYNDQEEHVFAEHDLESNHDLEPTTVTSTSATVTSRAVDNAITPRDAEAGGKHVLITFEPGLGEDPKEWSKAVKW